MGQPTQPPSLHGSDMSTGQIVVMLCGWGVKVGWPILLVDKRVEGPIKLCDLINSCHTVHFSAESHSVKCTMQMPC